jgi:hypothetical protein|tara:strand:+ start:2173 stop:2853 length:681 start_codon:yes stop_codon:yes gene_type:complete
MAQQPIVVTTPTGVAQYPWLSKADTKWNEAGEFKTNLILSKEAAKPIIDQINSVFAENVQAETKNNGGKDIKTANPPYFNEVDESGKPTGNVIIKFKSQFKPTIFDSQGSVMTESNIWGGSEIKVNAEVSPYITTLIGAGVSLRLKAVQVIKYVEGGTSSADNFGFQTETGFVQPTEPTAETSGFGDNTAVQSDVTETAPAVKQESAPPIEEPADVKDIVKKWSTK